MQNITRSLLEEGVTKAIKYRWADGYRQVAYFKPHEARSHVVWLAANPRVAKPIYARDIATGRFSSLH